MSFPSCVEWSCQSCTLAHKPGAENAFHLLCQLCGSWPLEIGDNYHKAWTSGLANWQACQETSEEASVFAGGDSPCFSGNLPEECQICLKRLGGSQSSKVEVEQVSLVLKDIRFQKSHMCDWKKGLTLIVLIQWNPPTGDGRKGRDTLRHFTIFHEILRHLATLCDIVWQLPVALSHLT